MTDSTMAAHISNTALDGLRWRCLGPWRGGRVMAVCGHPAHSETFYSGASGGGVWRTDDSGATWRPLGDGTFRRGSVGAITIAPSTPDVVYVGTGECGLPGNVTGGDGVYMTEDGGETWRHCGLEATHNIARIVVHPADPETVYVAAFGHRFGPNPERGIYRSRDGGQSWSQILFHDEGTGAIDLVIDPDNPRVLYAALWRISEHCGALRVAAKGAASGRPPMAVIPGRTSRRTSASHLSGALVSRSRLPIRAAFTHSSRQPERMVVQASTAHSTGGRRGHGRATSQTSPCVRGTSGRSLQTHTIPIPSTCLTASCGNRWMAGAASAN